MTQIEGTVRAVFPNEDDPRKPARLTVVESDHYFSTRDKNSIRQLFKGDKITMEYEKVVKGKMTFYEISKIQKIGQKIEIPVEEPDIVEPEKFISKEEEIRRSVVIKAFGTSIFHLLEPKDEQGLQQFLKTSEHYLKTGEWKIWAGSNTPLDREKPKPWNEMFR